MLLLHPLSTTLAAIVQNRSQTNGPGPNRQPMHPTGAELDRSPVCQRRLHRLIVGGRKVSKLPNEANFGLASVHLSVASLRRAEARVRELDDSPLVPRALEMFPELFSNLWQHEILFPNPC